MVKIALKHTIAAVRAAKNMSENKSSDIKQNMHENGLYSYIYLKTYTEFTFSIKSQGHVSDDYFLYYEMHLSNKISSYGF